MQSSQVWFVLGLLSVEIALSAFLAQPQVRPPAVLTVFALLMKAARRLVGQVPFLSLSPYLSIFVAISTWVGFDATKTVA